MKKINKLLLSTGLLLSLAACSNTTTDTKEPTRPVQSQTPVQTPVPTAEEPTGTEAYRKIAKLDATTKENMSVGGYLQDVNNDYSKYVGTEAYKVVNTADELLAALKLARTEYTTTVTEHGQGYIIRNNVRANETNWQRAIDKGLYLKNADGTYTKIPNDVPFSDPTYTATMVYYEDSPVVSAKYEQELVSKQTVHVIEIAQDINLGYNVLSDEAKASGIVNNYIDSRKVSTVTMSDMATENGISQIAIERTNDLLIYSRNGAKLTHGGFKINYCKNVAIRNLDMDELWQWEDTASKSVSKIGDYDTFGWAYFKIGFSDNIWIDHCSFGKSYDGQIDVANPYYQSLGTASSAPYQADGSADVHISWCDFHAGDASKDGYIYKMMNKLEEEYVAANGADTKNLYYKALRDKGFTFEQILNGIAVPQKKGFLLGDSGSEYYYNLNLNVSFANCTFKNIADRLPKIRGGNAYMYNCVVDNLEYMEYRSVMKTNASAAVSAVNSKWKCAFTSQGLVIGNGASACANGCIFKGIQYLIKNNDTSFTNNSGYEGATKNGGYHLINFQYQLDKASYTVSDEQLVTKDCSGGVTNVENFKWNTPNGNAPFNPSVYSLDTLTSVLESEIGSGTVKGLEEMLLIFDYKNVK